MMPLDSWDDEYGIMVLETKPTVVGSVACIWQKLGRLSGDRINSWTCSMTNPTRASGSRWFGTCSTCSERNMRWLPCVAWERMLVAAAGRCAMWHGAPATGREACIAVAMSTIRPTYNSSYSTGWLPTVECPRHSRYSSAAHLPPSFAGDRLGVLGVQADARSETPLSPCPSTCDLVISPHLCLTDQVESIV